MHSESKSPGAAPAASAGEGAELFQPLIDALTAQVALLDGKATIVAVNAAWQRFAREKGDGLSGSGIGTSYVKLLNGPRKAGKADGKCPRDAETAARLAKGVRQVLGGQADRYQLEYSCVVPPETFCFLATVTPLAGNGPVAALLALEDVTARKLAATARDIAAAAFESLAGMVVTDADSVVLQVNRAFSESTGYSAAEMVGRKISMLKSGRHDTGFYRAMWQAIEQTGSWQGEIWDRRKNGEVYPKLLAISSVRDASGAVTHYVGAQYDRSAIRQAEAELRIAAAAFESMQCAMIVDEGGVILRINPAFTALTGYSGADAIGNSAKLLHKEDADQDGLRDALAAVREKRPGKAVLRNYRKDGSLFWNELSISPVKAAGDDATDFICVMNDITARKDAEQQLMAWALRLDALTSMSEDGLIAFDDSGALSYVNGAFLRLSGLTEAELGGLPLDAFEEAFARRCDPRHPYRKVVEEIAGPASASIEATGDETEIHMAPPQDRILLRKFCKASHGTSLLLYYHDITRARHVEDIKSEFLATAAHELRTPMASIFGYTELLLMRTFEPERSRELLEIILRQSRRVTELLNELLDLARIEARRGKDFKLADHGLRSILDDVAATFTGSARRIVIVMPDESIRLNVDKEKIHQALINLLGNALKFSPVNKAVTVSVECTAGQTPPGITIAIQDLGIGMTGAHVERFGERFFRADPSGKVPGTGLGVSLSKEIINLHGGTLTISSEFGKGSCVTLWLPVAAPEPAA